VRGSSRGVVAVPAALLALPFPPAAMGVPTRLRSNPGGRRPATFAALALALGLAAAASLGSALPFTGAQRRGLALPGRPLCSAVIMEAAKKAAAASGAPIMDGDTVFIKGHTGALINAEPNADSVHARCAIKADRATLVIEKEGGGQIMSGDKIYLKCYRGGYIEVQGDMVRVNSRERSRTGGLTITMKEGEGVPVCEGSTIFLRGGERQTYVDLEGQDVRARWPDEGKWQVLTIDK